MTKLAVRSLLIAGGAVAASVAFAGCDDPNQSSLAGTPPGVAVPGSGTGASIPGGAGSLNGTSGVAAPGGPATVGGVNPTRPPGTGTTTPPGSGQSDDKKGGKGGSGGTAARPGSGGAPPPSTPGAPFVPGAAPPPAIPGAGTPPPGGSPPAPGTMTGGNTPRPGTGGTGGSAPMPPTPPAPGMMTGTTPPSGGMTPTAPAQPPAISAKTCKNLDIVFSIDNSGSMREEQMVMGTTIFPAFAQKLKTISPMLESFRVGVLPACPNPGTFNTRGRSGACMFSSGKPWIESSSARLTEEFACVGAIDSAGSECSGNNDDEQPASAAAASVETRMGRVSAANPGFLRDEAILVIVAMTDEDEQPTFNATHWDVYNRIIGLKGNNVKRVVFLGIGGSKACMGRYGEAAEAKKLKEITNTFANYGRGVFWDLCAGSLEEGLGKAIETIKTACAEAPMQPPVTPPPPVMPPPPPPPVTPPVGGMGGAGGMGGTGGMGGRIIE